MCFFLLCVYFYNKRIVWRNFKAESDWLKRFGRASFSWGAPAHARSSTDASLRIQHGPDGEAVATDASTSHVYILPLRRFIIQKKTLRLTGGYLQCTAPKICRPSLDKWLMRDRSWLDWSRNRSLNISPGQSWSLPDGLYMSTLD